MNSATRKVEAGLIEAGFRPLREEGSIWLPLTFIQADGNLVGPFTWVIKARRGKAEAKRITVKTHKMFFPDWHQATPGDLLTVIERAQIEDSRRTHPDQPAKQVVRLLDPHNCPHPPERLFTGEGRDDTAPGGRVAWVACCVCGRTLNAHPTPLPKTAKTCHNKGGAH